MAQREEDIISTSDIANHTDFKEQNIRKRYMNDSKKQKFYDALQIGAFALKQGLTLKESEKALIDMGSTKDLIDG